MNGVEIYEESQLAEMQFFYISKLLHQVFLTDADVFFDFLLTMRNRRKGRQGTPEEATRSVIWQGETAIAHAAMFGRVVHTENGSIQVGALSGVCVRKDQRGKGYGVEVTKAALSLVDQGRYSVSLWQTQSPGFYEKLGARVITNPFVNSQNRENPGKDPWPDEVKMIYPAEYPWPEGVIDLNGGAY